MALRSHPVVALRGIESLVIGAAELIDDANRMADENGLEEIETTLQQLSIGLDDAMADLRKCLCAMARNAASDSAPSAS